MFSLHGYGAACLLTQFAQPDQECCISSDTKTEEGINIDPLPTQRDVINDDPLPAYNSFRDANK